jgi:lysophospholipase L1-like esterase
MKFRTEVTIEKGDFEINHQSKILFLGSCFAENIGNMLEKSRFRTDINPFGILYNPLSVKKSIEYLLSNKQFTMNDLVRNEGIWHSFAHHGRFSGENAEEVLTAINNRIQFSTQFLLDSYYLFITLGSAWVYFLKSTGDVVSNCHKFQNSIFDRTLISVETIVNELFEVLTLLLQHNPKLKIIFTVSPVRHWKDGANGNQLSKASLLLAISALQKKMPQISYFPAYELVIDDLRDYRFYADDLLHPNTQAVEYIYEKFAACYFSKQTNDLNEEILSIERGKAHKPFNPNTENHQLFLQKLNTKIENLERKLIHFNK